MERLRNLQFYISSNIDRNPPTMLGESVVNYNADEIRNKMRGKQMELIVEKKNVFGVERIYPKCNKSRILTALTGQRTLLDCDIKLIKQLGYKLTTKSEEV
jgi:hypothetical protein